MCKEFFCSVDLNNPWMDQPKNSLDLIIFLLLLLLLILNNVHVRDSSSIQKTDYLPPLSREFFRK